MRTRGPRGATAVRRGQSRGLSSPLTGASRRGFPAATALPRTPECLRRAGGRLSTRGDSLGSGTSATPLHHRFRRGSYQIAYSGSSRLFPTRWAALRSALVPVMAQSVEKVLDARFQNLLALAVAMFRTEILLKSGYRDVLWPRVVHQHAFFQQAGSLFGSEARGRRPRSRWCSYWCKQLAPHLVSTVRQRIFRVVTGK